MSRYGPHAPIGRLAGKAAAPRPPQLRAAPDLPCWVCPECWRTHPASAPSCAWCDTASALALAKQPPGLYRR